MKSVQPNAGRNRSFNIFVLNGNVSPSGDAPQGAQDDSWRGKISRSRRAGGADTERDRSIWVGGGVTHPSALSEKRNRGRRFSSCVIKCCNRRGDESWHFLSRRLERVFTLVNPSGCLCRGWGDRRSSIKQCCLKVWKKWNPVPQRMGANSQSFLHLQWEVTRTHDWATTAATVCAASNNSSNNDKFCYRTRSNNLLNEACIPELSGDDASVRMASGLRWRERRKEQEAGNDRDIGRKKK